MYSFFNISIPSIKKERSRRAERRKQIRYKKIFCILNGDRNGSNDIATELDDLLHKGMNEKKKHEVDILASLILSISSALKISTVLDIGAGQGFLSHTISLLAASRSKNAFQEAEANEGSLKVFAIDSSGSQIQNSLERTHRLKQHLGSDDYPINHSSIHAHLKTDISLQELESLLSPNGSEGSSSIYGRSIALAGNHTCGDLSPTMIRLFLNLSKRMREGNIPASNNNKIGNKPMSIALVNVSCCYHLLTEEPPSSSKQMESGFGFPLSETVRDGKIFLNKRGRMLASQAVDRWRQCSDCGSSIA